MSNLGVNIIITAKDQASAVFSKLSGNIGSSQKSLSQKATEVGRSFAIMGTATTGALALSAKTAIDFESAFAGVIKTYDSVTGSASDTEKELKQIDERFRGLSKTIPVSYVELSKIGELAGQLGVRGVDQMTKFTDTIAKISVATNLTSEQAATDFARISNIMQEPIDNVDRMGATVVDLGNNFATTEVEISNFAQRIAGAGSIAGLVTSDIFAIGTAMSSVGVEAEAGGTAVQKVLIAMNTAVATGNEDLQSFASTAGMTVDQFKDLSPIERFTAFVSGLGDAGDGAITMLEDLGLQDQRLIRSFLSLANAGDLLVNAVDKSSQAWGENSALTEEAEKRFATTASQMGILKNNLALVSATLGEELLPIINKVVQAMLPYAEKVAEFIKEHPKLTVGVLAIVSALGLIATAIFVLTPVVTGLVSLFSILSTVFTVVGGVIAGISAPVLIVIAVIAGLIAIGVLLWKNWDLVKQKASELWAWLVQVWAGIQESISQFITNAIAFFQQLPARLFEIMKTVITVSLFWWVYLAGFLYTIIPTILQFIYDWWQQLPEKISGWLQNMQERATAIFESTKETLVNLASALVIGIVSFIATLPARAGAWFESTKQKVTEVWENLKTTVINGAKAMVDGAVNFFATLPERVLNAIGDLARKVRDKIVGAFQSGVRAGESFKLKIEGFQFGGMVPGAMGKPQLAVVHGGEEVIPYHSQRPSGGGGGAPSGGGGASIQINLNAGAFMGSRAEARQMAEELYAQLVILAGSQNKTVAQYMGG